MIYDPNKAIDVQSARARLEKLIEDKDLFELTKKRKRRSISQNSYLHLLFGWFAEYTGYTFQEVKQDIFKKEVNPGLFYEGEHGDKIVVQRWRSTADLDTKEMTEAIDRFRNFSSKELGLYLPEPSDMAALQEIEIELSKSSKKKYL